jgi:dihydroorotate dehydrogenase
MAWVDNCWRHGLACLEGFRLPASVLDIAYRRLVRPLLFRFDAERVHHVAMAFLHGVGPLMQLIQRQLGSHFGREREVFGLKFPNPIGLAAGFDKNAHVLPAWEGLGFGFAEVGTITAKAQPGNPKPRLFRVPEIGGVINRMGFNNDGAAVVAERLEQLRGTPRWPRFPVGINLGKSKVTPLEEATSDYLASFGLLRELGDYFVLNVSSPNTPGLRKLQDRGALGELFQAVQGANAGRKPILVKIAPDLTWEAVDDVLALVEEHGIAGVIATNTTIDHSSVPEGRRETGGLSGKPVRARATEVIRYITSKSKTPVIGVGGIFTADDVREKMDAGAVLVQVYTGFIYQGPGMVRAICGELPR